MDTLTRKTEVRSLQHQLLGKRLLDFLGAAAGLLLLSPVFAFIAIAIRLDSPGPVFFRQKRMGVGGQTFLVWKFRTMVADAEAQLKRLEQFNESEGGVLFKMKNDPRVTGLGQFLRRTSLDELPQLFNVLWGEMSLVGPRPLQERDCQRARAVVDSTRLALRQSVMPGMTGLWQVSGRSELSFEQMLDLDLVYVENWSLAYDLTLLWRTIVVVVARRGAY
ncbi:exopolysaccharide biosynthesis polyprenyl glycosylphosphotransferase [Gloeobacter morelensis]|uniref:Exopolysaccharide biosynthesis polyprenyl glycosylphosphotransferase n=1 Tax=Gloeobacter morelensis MG652769 TaxID=2781736 RepID=A0ABY3PP44_9CYAN|nr:exopolysaccharide biosynthesis polyprenyl glycosylphosphotransferase [Gloeobacter morelensis]UFP95427.1 exopolysaccharide biosynthesis polyprenyl glycosylphosphotransferase [Gloeobacter morelensis MG652769]